jgi:histidinol phosphatase-like enzyme
LFKTLFIDIDGVLVKNGGEYFEPKWGWCEPLEKNVKLINRLYDTGKVMVILTTARSEKYEHETIDDLKHAGVKYHRIMYGLLHSQRILINDFANSNPYPSAVAINIKRDIDQLDDYLKHKDHK